MLPSLGQGAQAAAFFCCGAQLCVIYALLGFARPKKHRIITLFADILFWFVALALFAVTALHICDGELHIYSLICLAVGFLLQYGAIWPIIKAVRESFEKKSNKKAAESRGKHDEG